MTGITQDDLGGAWTPKAPLKALPQDAVAQGPCGSAMWGHDVAGYQSSFRFGSGAALSVVLAGILIVLSTVYLWLLRRQDNQ